ncbi:MAG: hypothetical protein LBJ17_00830 [Dysgonamonadaceae bacterium]|jgi:hypothetical protein|nr:hypothetical protein [Dysgonamonadaceae bacterium]
MGDNNSDNGGRYGIVFVFECVMAIFYVVFGIVLLFTLLLDRVLFYNQTVKLTVGVLFLVYGIFRIYRSCKKIREKEQEND